MKSKQMFYLSREITIYREGRGTAPSFLNISTRWEVSDQFHTHEKDPPAPIELKAGLKFWRTENISLFLPQIGTRIVSQNVK